MASLAARFSFDDLTNVLEDSGPNDVLVNASDYVVVSGVKGSQAILLNSSSSSYFQAFGFRFLSYNDAPLSLSLWVQPVLRQGVLIGSSLGYSPLAFTANGSLIARIDTVSLVSAAFLQLAPIWTHIVLMWSSINGLRLYVDTQLVATTTAPTSTGSGMITNYLTLGGGSFVGAIDEWRIYSRELTTSEICAVFST